MNLNSEENRADPKVYAVTERKKQTNKKKKQEKS